MASANDTPDSSREEREENESLMQLRRLAMLYHARGRVEEAREIYALILELKNSGNKSGTNQRTNSQS